MDINKRNRSEIKSYFLRKAVPTESNFADLIDGMLNQKDDGIAKLSGHPLGIEATGDETSERRALDLFQRFADDSPEWTLALHPRESPLDPLTGKRGLGVVDGSGACRLFLDHATGNLGVGTLAPQDRLHVAGNARVDAGLAVGSINPAAATLLVNGAVEFTGDVKFSGTSRGPTLAWQLLPLKGPNCVSNSPTTPDPEFSNNGSGIVRLRGTIKIAVAIAANTVVATLPEGYRPTGTSFHVAVSTPTPTLNQLEIRPNGDIVSVVAVAVNRLLHLDGIMFSAPPTA